MKFCARLGFNGRRCSRWTCGEQEAHLTIAADIIYMSTVINGDLASYTDRISRLYIDCSSYSILFSSPPKVASDFISRASNVMSQMVPHKDVKFGCHNLSQNLVALPRNSIQSRRR